MDQPLCPASCQGEKGHGPTIYFFKYNNLLIFIEKVGSVQIGIIVVGRGVILESHSNSPNFPKFSPSTGKVIFIHAFYMHKTPSD
jgi:hypothetical protein